MTKNLSMLRISTEEIDEAVQQLEAAYTEGRLDDIELEDRMAKALCAKTKGDLLLLFHDLSPIERPLLQRLPESSVAIFSGLEQKGNFILPKNYEISAIFGGCMIDLSKVHLESAESIINISAIFGGVKVFVPKGIRVEIVSKVIFGGVSKKLCNESLLDNVPVIHINAEAIFGGIELITKEEEHYLK